MEVNEGAGEEGGQTAGEYPHMVFVSTARALSCPVGSLVVSLRASHRDGGYQRSDGLHTDDTVAPWGKRLSHTTRIAGLSLLTGGKPSASQEAH